MIKDELAGAIAAALESARAAGEITIDETPEITLEMPKNRAHGDWACNVALALARSAGLPPREIAARLVARLAVGGPLIKAAEIAGPGFINLTLRSDWLHETIRRIRTQDALYGCSQEGAGQSILLEYVSTNPNGPITVAGGRNAAIGDALAALLEGVGYRVVREYYINDALNSVQMNNFGKSVFYRYRELLEHSERNDYEGVEDWMYQGEYVADVARTVIAVHGDAFLSWDADDPKTVHTFRALSQDGMVAQQKADLEAFGVRFDNWFSEASLHDDGRVSRAIAALTERGYTYEHDGALWLKTTEFGDDKDRVLLRANGTPTYIAGDVAYHKDKFDRGFDYAIDVWGADHAGYIARTKAAVAALGYNSDHLEVLLYQLVRILKDGVLVKSSKRKGDVLELKADLIDEIGKDAARFFYLTRSPHTELDIDLDLAKRTEKENPVYYVQYAHARIVQSIEKAAELGVTPSADADLSRLGEEAEVDLIKKLSEYPTEVSQAAGDRAPQRMTQYVRDLAALFHAFYDQGNRNPALRIAADDTAVAGARVALADATRIVLRNALGILGVSAPDRM